MTGGITQKIQQLISTTLSTRSYSNLTEEEKAQFNQQRADQAKSRQSKQQQKQRQRQETEHQ